MSNLHKYLIMIDLSKQFWSFWTFQNGHLCVNTALNTRKNSKTGAFFNKFRQKKAFSDIKRAENDQAILVSSMILLGQFELKKQVSDEIKLQKPTAKESVFRIYGKNEVTIYNKHRKIFKLFSLLTLPYYIYMLYFSCSDQAEINM